MDLSDPHVADFFFNKSAPNSPASSDSTQVFQLDSSRIKDVSSAPVKKKTFADRVMTWRKQKEERMLRAQQVKTLEEKACCQDVPTISEFAKRFSRREHSSLPQRLIEEGVSIRAKHDLLAVKAAEEKSRLELKGCTFYPDTSITSAVFPSRPFPRAYSNKKELEVFHRPRINQPQKGMDRVAEYLKSDVFDRLAAVIHASPEVTVAVEANEADGKQTELFDFLARQDRFEEKRRLQLENEKFRALSQNNNPALCARSLKLMGPTNSFFSRLSLSSQKRRDKVKMLTERHDPTQEFTFAPMVMPHLSNRSQGNLHVRNFVFMCFLEHRESSRERRG